MTRQDWMVEAISQLPGLLVDDSAGEAFWAWKTLPEVEAALERAYLRGDRGAALVAAWREADVPPGLIAEVDAFLARKAATQAENKAKIEAASEARAAAAKMRSQSSPGESASAPPQGGSSAPQKKTPSENTPEEEGGLPRGEPGGASSSKAKKPARPNQKSPVATAAAASSTLMKKFGEAIMGAGFTGIPNLFLKHQKELKLSHLDMLLVIHLFSFWWEPAGFIWPSKATLAARLNAAECTVRRRIVRMEDMGYVQRVFRKGEEGGNKTNVYDLNGLIAKLNELALKAEA